MCVADARRHRPDACADADMSAKFRGHIRARWHGSQCPRAPNPRPFLPATGAPIRDTSKTAGRQVVLAGARRSRDYIAPVLLSQRRRQRQRQQRLHASTPLSRATRIRAPAGLSSHEHQQHHDRRRQRQRPQRALPLRLRPASSNEARRSPCAQRHETEHRGVRRFPGRGHGASPSSAARRRTKTATATAATWRWRLASTDSRCSENKPARADRLASTARPRRAAREAHACWRRRAQRQLPSGRHHVRARTSVPRCFRDNACARPC